MTTDSLIPTTPDEASLASESDPTRRWFLVAAGAVGAAAVAAACGNDSEPSGGTAAAGGSSTTSTTAAKADDAAVAKVAAGLEVLAVETYTAAAAAATAGKLGPVPPAVVEYVTTALGHHKEHLAAWNKVITAGGGTAVTAPNAKLKPTVDAEFAKVTDAAGAAKLALMLEEIAAHTYLKVLPTLGSKDAIKLAGSIQAVDQQHRAILLFALGQYPVPEVFQKTDKAAV